MTKEFQTLVDATAQFEATVATMPTQNNAPEAIASRAGLGNRGNARKKIGEYAQSSRIILPPAGREHIEAFLALKREQGTAKEQALYGTPEAPKMDVEAFIQRLLTCRPLTCNTKDDAVVFSKAKKAELTAANNRKASNPMASWTEEFSRVGQDNEDPAIGIKEFLTPDERLLSSLLINTGSMSPCINDVNRAAPDKLGKKGTYQEDAYIIGQVGNRLEQEGGNEEPLCMIYEGQQEPRVSPGMQAYWQERFNLTFPSLERAETSRKCAKLTITKTNRYGNEETSTKFFNMHNYKELMRPKMLAYLAAAEAAGVEQNRDVSAYMVAMGASSWRGDVRQELLVQCQVELFRECIAAGNYPHIKGITLGGFINEKKTTPEQRDKQTQDLSEVLSKSGFAIHVDPAILFDAGGNEIQVALSNEKNPASLELFPGDKKMLRVFNISWDGFSFPGNEYFMRLFTSNDPACAAATMFNTLHNVLINGANLMRNIFQVGQDNQLCDIKTNEPLMIAASTSTSTSSSSFSGYLPQNPLTHLFHRKPEPPSSNSPIYLTAQQKTALEEYKRHLHQEISGLQDKTGEAYQIKQAKLDMVLKIQGRASRDENCRDLIEDAKNNSDVMHGKFSKRTASLLNDLETNGLTHDPTVSPVKPPMAG